MIQRIQTIYLFIALILGILLFFSPIAEILTGGNQILEFKTYGLYEVETGDMIIKTLPLTILISAIVFFYSIAILMYKRRVLQSRICVFNILLFLGLIGLIFYYLSFVFRKADSIGSTFLLAALYPVISIIITYLAFRSIRKDEQIVRAIDRLR